MSNDNDITALRKMLFETLQGVKTGAMDLDRAKAINEIGKTLVDTARVEVDFLRTTGGDGSEFLGAPASPPPPAPPGVTGTTVHKLR